MVDPSVDLESIPWRLEELPPDLRLEFLRRVNAGYAVIDGVWTLRDRVPNPSNVSRGTTWRAAGTLIAIFAALGAAGHLFSVPTYFYLGLLPLVLLIWLFLDDTVQADAQHRIRQEEQESLRQLRYQWISSGFEANRFDDIWHMAIMDRDKEQQFRKWWAFQGLKHLTSFRRINNLPELENCPSWKLY